MGSGVVIGSIEEQVTSGRLGLLLIFGVSLILVGFELVSHYFIFLIITSSIIML
jgi:hypothetical protein